MARRPVDQPSMEAEACPAFDEDHLEKALAVLGYPGFAYLTSYLKFETDYEGAFDPTELIRWAIAQNVLNTRVMEALPWLIAAYATQVDWKRLIGSAQRHAVQNRLGYLACLALQLVESKQSLSHPEARRLLKESVSRLQEIRQPQEQTLMNEEMGPVMRSSRRLLAS
jgi:hypothetical protein